MGVVLADDDKVPCTPVASMRSNLAADQLSYRKEELAHHTYPISNSVEKLRKDMG